MRQITLWRPIEHIIYSEYGCIPYKEWTQKELERLSEGEEPNTYFTKTKEEAGYTWISIWTTKKSLAKEYRFKAAVPYLNRVPKNRKIEHIKKV